MTQTSSTCSKSIMKTTEGVICFKLTIMTLERCQLPRSDVFGNFEHISDIDFVFSLLTLSK